MLQNKIQGCLIGGAVGDALGYQIEFQREIKEKQVTRFKDDFGIISDDTQMTLFTAIGLMRYATFSHMCPQYTIQAKRDIFDGYLDWLDTQKDVRRHQSVSWIKEMPELNKRRAPGTTCLRSLDKGIMGTTDTPINKSDGCGSVMRVAPCGIFADDADKAGLLAVDCAAITHGHKIGWVSSFVCAYTINVLLNNTNIDIEHAFKQACHAAELHSQLFYQKPKSFFETTPMAEFMNLVDRAIWLSKEPLQDTECIRQIGEGWTAAEALAIAIYACIKYPTSFEDAIICAVNHDGDSDSTGAIAGNIMGAFLGLDAIPDYYFNNLELKDTIIEIANDMFLYKNMNSPINDLWKRKYVDCELPLR